MHLLDPVAQTVHDHPADDRVIAVERIPAAGVVGVPGAVLVEDVVSRVVDSAETERRTGAIAFGGVVEHHVEDDLDAGPVKSLYHVTELVHGAECVGSRAISWVRREEGDRLVTPVVDQPRRASLGVERVHRKQFDGGDAEFPEIGDLLDQSGERAPGLLTDPGAGVASESADVHLIDDGA